MNPIKKQIKALIDEAKGFSALIGDWTAYQEAEKKFWAKVGLLTDGQRLERMLPERQGPDPFTACRGGKELSDGSGVKRDI